MDLNQAAWHMGLMMDDPDVAALADGWGEIVAMGEGASDAPRAAALDVVREALKRDPALFVAMTYLGMLTPGAVEPFRHQSQLVERLSEIPPAPEPRPRHDYTAHGGSPPPGRFLVIDPQGERAAPRADAQTAIIRAEGVRLQQRNQSPIHPETGRTLFAMWVEKEIPWSPMVMGWTEDDPRVPGMMEETKHERGG